MYTLNTGAVRHGFALIVVFCIGLALTTGGSTRAAQSQPSRQTLLPGSRVPAPVRSILQRACQDCHSENTVWPWYSHIPPISWQLHSDVMRGRAFMNLSRWNDYTKSQQRGYLSAIVTATETHVMPPPKYVWIHQQAKLTGAELDLIRQWALAERRAFKRDNSEGATGK